MRYRRLVGRSMFLVLFVGLMVAACGSESADTTATIADSTTSTTTTSTTAVTPSSTTTEPPDMQELQVFFATGDGTDCSEVTGFVRSVDAGLDQVSAALQLLVTGPTVEEMAAGAGSFFSAESEGALRSVSATDETLVVDFRDMRQMLSNASTSCGSESLLAQLNSTVFQFGSIERVRYEIDGSCDDFSNWLQRECAEYTRLGAEPANLDTNERASGSGCTPDTQELPDGRWFGFATGVSDTNVTFDLACWFSGSAAADAAAEDGEESPPPNDYYIRNTNDQLRTIPASGSTSVTWLPTADPADAATSSYAEWVEVWPTRSYLPGLWLDIEGGEITLIEEQYVP